MAEEMARSRTAAFALGELQQQQLREREDDEGDDEQDEPKLDQRRRVDVSDGFGELVRKRRCDAVPWREDRRRELMSIADQERHGHRLTERAAQSEHDAAEHAEFR